MEVMSREQTLEFLNPLVKTETLMKHFYAVDTVQTNGHQMVTFF